MLPQTFDLADLARKCTPRWSTYGEDAFAQALLIAQEKYNPNRRNANLRAFIATCAWNISANAWNKAQRTISLDEVLSDWEDPRQCIDPTRMDWDAFPPEWLPAVQERLCAIAQDEATSEADRRAAGRGQQILCNLVDLVKADAIGGLNRTDLTELLRQQLVSQTGEPLGRTTIQGTLAFLRAAVRDELPEEDLYQPYCS